MGKKVWGEGKPMDSLENKGDGLWFLHKMYFKKNEMRVFLNMWFVYNLALFYYRSIY